jgi:hypothetical protein
VRRHRIRRLSFGFLVFLGSHCLLVAFLAWGYTRPDLDLGWYILQKMRRTNFEGLSLSDVETLRRLLRKHPQFSQVLIGSNRLGFVEPTDDGWMSLPAAHVVVQPSSGAPLEVRVGCRAPRSAYPVSVALEVSGSREVLDFASDGQRVVDWSRKASSAPLWVQVDIKPNSAGIGLGAAPEVHIGTTSAALQKVESWH